MAEYTSNYNLKKPSQTDFVNIDDINGNMDIIDEKVKEISDSASDSMQKVPTATDGNMAVFDSTGTVADSGLKFSVYNGGLRVTYDDGQ